GRDPLIEPDQHLAGFPSDDGGFVVGPGKAADGIQVIKERQGHELGLLTEAAPQQPRSPEPRNPPQDGHDLGAIVLLIAFCLVRTRPASPHACDDNTLLLSQSRQQYVPPWSRLRPGPGGAGDRRPRRPRGRWRWGPGP